jgi:hypothetical protein|eukprot:7391450-Prymnesium_polylepis.1
MAWGGRQQTMDGASRNQTMDGAMRSPPPSTACGPPSREWIERKRLAERVQGRKSQPAAKSDVLDKVAATASWEFTEVVRPDVTLGCRCDMRGLDCPIHLGKEKWRFDPAYRQHLRSVRMPPNANSSPPLTLAGSCPRRYNVNGAVSAPSSQPTGSPKTVVGSVGAKAFNTQVPSHATRAKGGAARARRRSLPRACAPVAP